MKDLFKLTMGRGIGIGGWKCYCCNPLSRRGGLRGKQKSKFHKRARSRMKREGFEYDI